MKKFVCIAVALCGLAVGSSKAVTPPASLPMLRNAAAFEDYTLSQAVGGSVYVSSGGMNYSSNNITPYIEVYTNTVDPVKLLGALASQSLTFALLHPSNDTAQTACYLFDQDHQILFSGWSASFLLSRNASGKLVAPTNAGAITLGFVGWMSVPLGAGASGAQLYVRDHNGNIIWYQWIQADGNGKIYFPESWCGTGDLVVYYNDGTRAPYDLRNGGLMISSDVVGLQVTPTLQNLDIVLETTGKISINPVSQNGKGTAKIVQMAVSFDRWILCSGVTSEGERASSVVVHDLVNKTIQSYPIPSGQSSIFILLKAGLYHVYMTWENGFDEGDPSQFYQYNDGGKG